MRVWYNRAILVNPSKLHHNLPCMFVHIKCFMFLGSLISYVKSFTTILECELGANIFVEGFPNTNYLAHKHGL